MKVHYKKSQISCQTVPQHTTHKLVHSGHFFQHEFPKESRGESDRGIHTKRYHFIFESKNTQNTGERVRASLTVWNVGSDCVRRRPQGLLAPV